MLDNRFFTNDACHVAKSLLGKVIRRKYNDHWLATQIIETEAYYLEDKASHSSLGYTEKRQAMFMPPGTIYMYYARGADSLNISCGSEGDAVLIKSAIPYIDKKSGQKSLHLMQQLNLTKQGKVRANAKLCAGQTLLCKALHLKVNDWDKKNFSKDVFYIEDTGYIPEKIISTTRLGIKPDRNAHLPYRFIDFQYTACCTSNPLTKRNLTENIDYKILQL